MVIWFEQLWWGGGSCDFCDSLLVRKFILWTSGSGLQTMDWDLGLTIVKSDPGCTCQVRRRVIHLSMMMAHVDRGLNHIHLHDCCDLSASPFFFNTTKCNDRNE